MFSEHKEKADKKDKGSVQIEFERSQKECTFRPSLYHFNFKFQREKGKSKESSKGRDSNPRSSAAKNEKDIYDKLKPNKLREELMNAKPEIEYVNCF